MWQCMCMYHSPKEARQREGAEPFTSCWFLTKLTRKASILHVPTNPSGMTLKDWLHYNHFVSLVQFIWSILFPTEHKISLEWDSLLKYRQKAYINSLHFSTYTLVPLKGFLSTRQINPKLLQNCSSTAVHDDCFPMTKETAHLEGRVNQPPLSGGHHFVKATLLSQAESTHVPARSHFWTTKSIICRRWTTAEVKQCGRKAGLLEGDFSSCFSKQGLFTTHHPQSGSASLTRSASA